MEIVIALLVVAAVTVVAIRVVRDRRNKQAQERARRLVEGLRDSTKPTPMPFANFRREPVRTSPPNFLQKPNGKSTDNENLRD